MPALELLGRHQRAAVWQRTGNDRHGEVIVSAPTDMKVRWEEGERDVQQGDGTVIRIQGTITPHIELPMGSILWLAPDPRTDAVEQWYGLGSAGDDSGLMIVVTKDWGQDLKGRHNRYEYGLAKYRDTLPTVT